jgi:hypothetical protein
MNLTLRPLMPPASLTALEVGVDGLADRGIGEAGPL